MATTVKTRANHYQTLGLTPAASEGEIARAFAREISLSQLRAFGGVAEVSIAYEVLRDPAKRRAYDESLGLNAPPPPPVERPERYSLSIPAIHLDPPARPEPKAEARMASFIASSLREPAQPEPRHDPSPPPRIEPSRPSLEPRPAIHLTRPHPIEEDRDAQDQPIDWKRAAGIAGALVAAVGLIGAWAGWEAGNDGGAEQEMQPKRAVTVALPRAKPVAPEASLATISEAKVQRRARPAVAARRAGSAPVANEIAMAAPAPRDPPEVNPAEEAVAEAEPAAVAVAASLPLSNATIARTIGRIGYSCGQVASTSHILGNVFKVTCTSGDSYRAAPIHGRYRFKRL